MDERGELITTDRLADRFRDWDNRAVKEVSFLIGGAGGHDPLLRERADWLWALSPLTFQHELALLVLMEQIYRAQCIIAGHPYHRD
jgi:23S rRNA (pseudouridine1915-N3)-methyltransferase